MRAPEVFQDTKTFMNPFFCLGVTVLSASLTAMFLFTIGLLLQYGSIGTSIRRKVFPHELCLIYDKPQRTGSTTVANALHKCWSDYYRLEPKNSVKQAEKAIKNMLSLKQSIVSHCKRHVSISDYDCFAIEATCQEVFHVTSTRKATERIASYAKVTSLKHKIGRNFTINPLDLRKAVQTVMKIGNDLEYRYEKGVYTGFRKIQVDYVIRNENLEQDLTALIQASGCNSEILSTNTHSVNSTSPPKDISTESSTVSSDQNSTKIDTPTVAEIKDMNETELVFWLNNFPIRMGDQLHKELLKTARRVNKNGLEKVAAFRFKLQKFRNKKSSRK